MNEDDTHTFRSLLDGGTALKSDADEQVDGSLECFMDILEYLQLIINCHFTQPVKVHSISIKGPKENAPKGVKLFINNMRTPSFDDVTGMEPKQALECVFSSLNSSVVIRLGFFL